MFILKKTYSLVLTALIILGSFFFSGNIENFVNEDFADGISITSVKAQSGTTNAQDPNTQGNSTPSSEAQDVHEMMNKLVTFLNTIGAVLAIIISPLILAVGWLMSPDWTTGDILWMQKVIYDLWIVVCNIIYIVYAILLIVVALGTIFNSQNYNYKKMLPRLLLGILMVPATWWVVQVIISLSTTATAVVLSIPMETMNKITANQPSWWTNNNIPEVITYKELWEKKLSQLCEDPSKCISPQKMLSNASGIYGNLLVYAYGVFRIQEIDVVKTNGLDVIKDFTGIVNNGLVGIIMYMVFGLLTIGLLLVLIFRVFWIFIYTIFSPLFTLQFVLGSSGSKSFDKFTVKDFLATAFVPAIVGLVLSVGLILVSAVHTGFNTSTNTSYEVTNNDHGGQSKVLFRIMGNPENEIIQETFVNGTTKDAQGNSVQQYGSRIVVKVWWIQIQFPGSSKQSDNTLSNDKSNSRGLMSLFWELIVQFIAIAFLYLAFTAAISVARIAEAVSQPFQRISETMKRGGAAFVKNVPLPLVGNVGGLEKTAAHIENTANERATAKYNNSEVGQMFQSKDNKTGNGSTSGWTNQKMKSISDSDIQNKNDQILKQLKALGDSPNNTSAAFEIKQDIKYIIEGSAKNDDKKASIHNFFIELREIQRGKSKSDQDTIMNNLNISDLGKKFFDTHKGDENQFKSKLEKTSLPDLQKFFKK